VSRAVEFPASSFPEPAGGVTDSSAIAFAVMGGESVISIDSSCAAVFSGGALSEVVFEVESIGIGNPTDRLQNRIPSKR